MFLSSRAIFACHSATAVPKVRDTSTKPEAVAAILAERGQRHLKRMAGVSERGIDHIETFYGPQILNSVDQIEKLDKVARRTFGILDVKDDRSQWAVNVAILGC